MFHITCLSSEFLAQEALSSDSPPVEAQVLPLMAHCPGCEKLTQWVDIVKPLSYRLAMGMPRKNPSEAESRKSVSRRKLHTDVRK